MRLPLAALEVFNAIAREGSLIGAAKSLGVQASTISHQLKALESTIGVTLFIRSTRSVRLTDAGRALLNGTHIAFDKLENALEAAQNTGQNARGSLRLTMPDFAYSLHVAPCLPSFLRDYPEIELDLTITDAFTDIVTSGHHAGFRLGDRIAQDMVAIRVTPPLALAVLGSQDYFVRNPTPAHPRDLLEHCCIRYRFQSSGHLAPWQFAEREQPFQVEVQGTVIVDTLPALYNSAQRGLGLIYTFLDYLKAVDQGGSLVQILNDYTPPSAGLFIYFPREYRSMTPLRLFIDHLKRFHANSEKTAFSVG